MPAQNTMKTLTSDKSEKVRRSEPRLKVKSSPMISKSLMVLCVLASLLVLVQEAAALTIAVPDASQDDLIYTDETADPEAFDKRSSAMHFFKRETPLAEELLKRSSPWHYGKRSSPWHYGKRSSPWHYGKRSSAMHFFKRDGADAYPYMEATDAKAYYA